MECNAIEWRGVSCGEANLYQQGKLIQHDRLLDLDMNELGERRIDGREKERVCREYRIHRTSTCRGWRTVECNGWSRDECNEAGVKEADNL